MLTHKWPRYIPPCDYLSIPILSKVGEDNGYLPFIDVPDVLDRADPGGVGDTYTLFYAEWDCHLGPDPDEPMAPVQPFDENIEALLFPTLFPFGIGHYLGPPTHRMSFERYTTTRVQLHDFQFQRNPHWLQWAISRTEDRGVVKALNCCLVILYHRKARHLGGGSMEVLPVDQRFERRRLIGGKLK